MIGVFDHPCLAGLFADDDACRIWSAERQLQHMLSFEAAYSRALGTAGVVETDVAASAALLIEKFKPDLQQLRDGTARDGLPVPALVAQLKKAGGSLAPAIHAGATSQDVLDTALALTLRETTDLLVARLKTLATDLDSLNDAFGANPLMGRTRMQAAMPIRVSDRLTTWRAPLDAHCDRLMELRPHTEKLQLGGAAGDRKELEPFGDRVARALAAELDLAVSDFTWHAARDGIAAYASVLSLITGTLGKMGQDICLMAQQGLDEIRINGGGGSSAMPHKANPILAELLVTLARFNATQLSGIHQAQVHEQERSGSAWALEWMILPQMAVAAARSLGAGSSLCRNVTSMGGASN
ncbi:3-carboxy-cis,cis-muconate cycloisomerase [Roseobacter sp.]|uniref:3-carboxy-cis,cis-muconate cycloisomerase n=1 Tax=Roseobacter sp. TaxID=1907202 RepID=UPI0025E58225|nr:3-carboxy-cis,cis-muconate cycloisomerase [Roseobacter sp.]